MGQIFSRALVAGAVCCIGLAGCQKLTPPADAAAVRNAVRDDEAQWNADWEAKDAKRIASHYAPDATVMIPGMAAVKGPDAIQQALEKLFASPNIGFQFAADKVGVAKSGDLAYARGPFRLTLKDAAGGPPLVRTGSYVRVYRQQPDGAWLVLETIATTGDGTDGPLPPH